MAAEMNRIRTTTLRDIAIRRDQFYARDRPGQQQSLVSVGREQRYRTVVTSITEASGARTQVILDPRQSLYSGLDLAARERVQESLQRFVGAAKGAGASDEFIAALLTRRGWPSEEVYGALEEYWVAATGVVLPVREGAGESARDAFLYLLSFVTLATWATALGSLLFHLIDHWFPDSLVHNIETNLRSAITWQIASIAVAFPIYLLTARVIFRETADRPERLKSGVRRWLTWIALLITAATMMCDLIWFVDYFLTGDLTVRFALKSAAVFVIAGAIFAYYLSALRWTGEGDLTRERSRQVWYGSGALACVAVAIVVGLAVAGTPSSQRRKEADRKRIADLQQIARGISLWRRSSTQLTPASLEDPVLARFINGHTTDPESGAGYEFHPEPDGRYQVCAVFSEASETDTVFDEFWRHGSGRTCFTLRADAMVP